MLVVTGQTASEVLLHLRFWPLGETRRVLFLSLSFVFHLQPFSRVATRTNSYVMTESKQ
jgi:hypothetical protein